jgi:anti-sigma-K factor RskA
MNHEEAFVLIPEYVLGSLEPDELERFESHLETCQECQSETRSCTHMIADISLGVPMVDPPVLLKSRILSQATRARTIKNQTRVSKWTNFFLSIRAYSPAFAFTGLALIFILFITNIWLWQRVNHLEKQTDFRLVIMEATEYTPDASGLIVISQDGREGTLVVAHLPQLNENQQYQLWLIRDQQRINGGVFSVDEEGYANLSIKSEMPLSGYDRFGITIEPFGGSLGPTGDKVLGGDL